MYVVDIETQEGTCRDYFSTKRACAKFIAKETGVSQKSIIGEIDAKSNSVIKRDSLGFRVEIFYHDPTEQ